MEDSVTRSTQLTYLEPLPTSVDNCKQGAVRAIRYNVDGEYLLSCGSDRTIKLWNSEKGLPIATYQGHSGDVMDARGSCDNAQIVSGSVDKNVAVWDVSTKRMVRRFRGHNASVSSVLWNEESSLIVSGSQDNSVKFWDVRSKSLKEVQSLDEPTDAVTSLAITDHSVLVGCADGWTRLYDIRQGTLSCDCIGESIMSVSISRDMASHLVSVVIGSMKLMDQETGQLLASYKADKDYRFDNSYKAEACFDFSDKFVIGGGYSKFYGNCSGPKIYCWDLITQALHKVGLINSKNKYPVTTLAAHPSKSYLAAGAGTGVYIFAIED